MAVHFVFSADAVNMGIVLTVDDLGGVVSGSHTSHKNIHRLHIVQMEVVGMAGSVLKLDLW